MRQDQQAVILSAIRLYLSVRHGLPIEEEVAKLLGLARWLLVREVMAGIAKHKKYVNRHRYRGRLQTAKRTAERRRKRKLNGT